MYTVLWESNTNHKQSYSFTGHLPLRLQLRDAVLNVLELLPHAHLYVAIHDLISIAATHHSSSFDRSRGLLTVHYTCFG